MNEKELHIGTVIGSVFGKTEINNYFSRESKSQQSTESKDIEDAEIVDEDVENGRKMQEDNEIFDELDYDAPQEGLKEFLTEEWLEELRSDESYNVGWINSFVDALFASPYGKEIARDWAVEGREKKNEIMGYVLGLLKDGGVLKGSYDSISKKVDLMEKYRSFSRNMGEGKKQPYALWVSEYIATNK